jgi:hypothetical protein
MTPDAESMTGQRATGEGEDPTLAHLMAGLLPVAFTRSLVTIPVGGSMPCAGVLSDDALLIVGRGVLEVETSDGSRTRFSTGAVLAVPELPAGRLHNSGPGPVHLVAVRRSSAARQ